MRRVLLLCACVSLCVVAVASGATRFVATTGSDTADGSTGAPYQHIQKCADVSVSGDICAIRAGTYRETVTPPTNGVTFQPDGSAIVTVSGADVVTGWTVHSGSGSSTIYKSTGMTWNLSVNFNQVFVDGQAVNLARFPNASLDLSHPTWLTADSSVPAEDIATNSFEIFDSALTQANGFWNGAEVTHLAAGMYTMAGTVTSYTTGHIVASNPHGDQSRFMESPRGDQYPYYLSNKLEALDTQGEWYFDGTTLYLWTPDSTNPTGHTVEAKRRQFAFELSGRSNITIRNLKIFASSINMNPSSANNVIDGLDAKYVWHQLRNVPAAAIGQTDPKWGSWNTGIILAGTDNVLKNCTIAWSSNNGVYLRNTHQTVENCTIHDVQYLASEGGAVSWMGDSTTGASTSAHVVRQNTLYNSGRHLVNHYYAQNALITNNLMYDFCITGGDCGATYTVKPEGSGTISFNIVHDTHSPYFNFGIYMDDDSQNWLVHHNVVWTNTGGCGIVHKSANFRIYNNTVNDSGTAICTSSASNVFIENNLGDSGVPGGGDNIQTTNAGYVNEGAHDYRLTSGSPAVNTGHSISGVTTNCVGTCDVGAYEFGATAWTAGATAVTPPTCPTGCTCTITAGVCDPTGPAPFYASPTGTGGCSTNSAAPSSLSTGLGCVQSGGTLYLRGGTYASNVIQNITSGTSSARTIYASAPGETAVIQPNFGGAGQGALFDVNASYVTFDRLTVDGTTYCQDGANNLFKLQTSSHHVRISNSILRNCQALDASGTPRSASKGILTTTTSTNNEILNTEITNNLGYGIYMNSANNVIDGCNIHGNFRFGIHMYDDTASNVHDNIVRNTRLWSNGDNTNCEGGCIQSGMIMVGTGHLVYNNLIYGNKGGGIQMDASSVRLYNNTIYGNQNDACIFGGGSATMTNNICATNVGGITAAGAQTTNLLTNPGFVNAAAGDFHLAESATTAINAGTNLGTVFTTDFEGTSRPQGTQWDIGAYEFGGTVGGPQAPVAWWKMEAGTGTTVVDSSGNNRTGTIQGPIWTGGRIGQFALQFDGINDVVSLPDAVLASFNNDHTVCQWAQVADITAIGTGGFKQTLMNLAQDTSNGLRIVEAEATPVGGWAVSVTAGGSTISRQTTTAAFTNNSWVHLCHTLSAGTLTLYTSGVAQTTSDPGGYSLGAGNFLGGQTTTTGNFGGKLDEVKIWNRALSASEIQAEGVPLSGVSGRVSHRGVFR